MNISEKIKEIQKEPLHVRLRYVWGCVALSMLLIIIIWFFSIAQMLQKGGGTSSQDADNNVANLKNQLQNIKQTAPSLGDQPQPLAGDGSAASASQNSNDFQYPPSGAADQTATTDPTTQAPQSPAYTAGQ